MRTDKRFWVSTEDFVFLNMYFSDYTNFQDAPLNPKLLWEYDLDHFDFDEMKVLVVQRVIERGGPNDCYFMLNYYGLEGVKSAIKNITYMNDKDMNFVSHQFDIPLTAMKCFEKKQSVTQHWNS